MIDELKALLAKEELWVWAGISIARGIIVGLLIVVAIVIYRRKQTFNSLMALEDCIGLLAVVDIPFDQTMSGKVTIQLDHRTLACMAYTNQPHQFRAGDSVRIVGLKGHKVWVIPTQEVES